MILVSYIDILDYIGDDRQCLIEGEVIFNDDRVQNVHVSATEGYEVTAQCVCEDSSHSKNSIVSIKIDHNEKKSLSSKCTCIPDQFGKCGHVAATLIYLHRQPPDHSNNSHKAKSSPKSQVQSVKSVKEPVSGTLVSEEHDKRGLEQQSQRKLRHKRRSTVVETEKREAPSMITKSDGIVNDENNDEMVDDPTWDKENDGDEDESLDFGQSSDDDWKPVSEKKRLRRESALIYSENSKTISKTSRKKRNQMTKAEADQKAKELIVAALEGDDGQFSCHLCDMKAPKHDQLQDHIRDIHLLKKEVFSCSKCKRNFKLLRTLKAHESTCDSCCSEECEGGVHVSRKESKHLKEDIIGTCDVSEEEEAFEQVKVEPLQCLLCEVVSATRREMHDHYLVAHRTQDKDSISVCDRCGEFRLPRDHICPSQLAFRCLMCRSPFKAGRDYWNHLIRQSRRHGVGAGAGAGAGACCAILPTEMSRFSVSDCRRRAGAACLPRHRRRRRRHLLRTAPLACSALWMLIEMGRGCSGVDITECCCRGRGAGESEAQRHSRYLSHTPMHTS